LLHEDFDLDFKWYPEACLTFKGFATIDLFGAADVGPGSALCSIRLTAKDSCNGKQSSYELADEIEANSVAALAFTYTIKFKDNTELGVTMNNIKAMCYLSLYYAYKIRAATFKLAGKKENTTAQLGKAYTWWITYTNLMDTMYTGQSNQRNNAVLPDWHFQDAIVLKEFLDNGGIGTPTLNK
jgi:hypothetical protein